VLLKNFLEKDLEIFLKKTNKFVQKILKLDNFDVFRRLNMISY